MAQWKFLKEAVATPDANQLSVGYDTTLDALIVVDSAGNKNILGTTAAHPGGKSYRFVRRQYISQGTTSITLLTGTNALHVRGWGAGGGGAGVAQATASQITDAVGGGGGAYSEVWLTTITGAFTCVVGLGGPGGTAGANDGTSGTDTTFADNGVNKLTAKAGVKGTTANGLATGTAVAITAACGAGGAASGGTGDTKWDGGQGNPGIRLSGTVGLSGTGGNAAGGGPGGAAIGASATGSAGAFPGGGGGGAIDTGSAARAGGAGANGLLIVDEYIG